MRFLSIATKRRQNRLPPTSLGSLSHNKEQAMAKVDRTPLDQPTRAGVQQLFRDVRWRSHDSAAYDEYRKLDNEYDAKVEEFKNTSEMKALYNKAQAARKVADKVHERIKKLIAKTHRRFLATGLTPGTIKLINELIDELDKVGATEE